MSSELMTHIGNAIIYFFINPVWLFALLAAVLLGYVRVKRERRDFTIRVLPGLTELKHAIWPPLLYGLVLSILIAGAGLAVSTNWVILFSLFMLLAVLSFSYKLASPVYYAALAFFTLYALERWAGDFSIGGWFSLEHTDFFGELAVTVSIIVGLLLVAEGLLIRSRASRYASPGLIPTNRGLRGAVYQSKLLWLLPVVFIVPGDMISQYAPYWPQFTLGAEQFTFIPVPLVIGFSQIARATFPDVLFPKMGTAVAWLGIAVAAVGIAALWMPVLGWAALIAGVVCRIFLSVLISINERRQPIQLTPQSEGIYVVSVLKDSPADKMGIIAGDLIKSVNGITVHDEDELYNAIQVNAAHCRLQVIGRDGEVRLKQQVLYRHDHFRLGMLTVR